MIFLMFFPRRKNCRIIDAGAALAPGHLDWRRRAKGSRGDINRRENEECGS
jgi:hypothetical protein